MPTATTVFRIGVIAIAAGLAVAIAIQTQPEPVKVAEVVVRKVPVTTSRVVPVDIIEDGVKRTVYKPVQETMKREIRELVEKEVAPSREAWLRFALQLFVSGWFCVYTLFILVLWGRDKIQEKRSSQAREDTVKRLDAIQKFSLGIIAGLLAVGTAQTTESSQPRAVDSNYPSVMPSDTPSPAPLDNSFDNDPIDRPFDDDPVDFNGPGIAPT